MIPTIPGPGDIPTGPERPVPVRGTTPTVFRSPTDELEALKKTVQELRVQFKDLETRVSRLEEGIRTG